MYNKSKSYILATALAVATTLASCSSDDAENAPEAELKIQTTMASSRSAEGGIVEKAVMNLVLDGKEFKLETSDGKKWTPAPTITYGTKTVKIRATAIVTINEGGNIIRVPEKFEEEEEQEEQEIQWTGKKEGKIQIALEMSSVRLTVKVQKEDGTPIENCPIKFTALNAFNADSNKFEPNREAISAPATDSFVEEISIISRLKVLELTIPAGTFGTQPESKVDATVLTQDFISGKHYTLIVTVSNNGKATIGNVAIDGFADGGSTPLVSEEQ